MNPSFARLGLVTSVLTAALLTSACTDMFHSDAENAGRRSSEARQAALKSMKSSSAEAPSAKPVSGQALVNLLSGNTHVEAYVKRSGDVKPYLTTYDYYGPDGVFVAKDTYSRRTPEYQDVGRWKVEKDVLCVTVKSRQEEDSCYTIRVAANGAIQYWIHRPGDPFDGLLTRNVTTVRHGLQEPEYISDPAAFR